MPTWIFNGGVSQVTLFGVDSPTSKVPANHVVPSAAADTDAIPPLSDASEMPNRPRHFRHLPSRLYSIEVSAAGSSRRKDRSDAGYVVPPMSTDGYSAMPSSLIDPNDVRSCHW